MSYDSDARFLRDVILGAIDPAEPAIPARLAIMRTHHRRDAGMLDAIQRATEAHAVMVVRDPSAADRAYLQALADGSADYFANDVYERLELTYFRHLGDEQMMALFTRAAGAFADAAMDAAAVVLAGPKAQDAIENARHRARDS